MVFATPNVLPGPIETSFPDPEYAPVTGSIYKAEPPKGGHGSLAAAATNPIANLIQVQDQLYWSNHNSDGDSNYAVVQPVVPFRLPRESVPSVVTRNTFTYVSKH